MSRTDSDETYVLNLCDEVLGLSSVRQHTFDFLRGDPDKRGRTRKLPVDAYYPPLSLVIEYREIQHAQPIALFDKTDAPTVSGVHRGVQRALYDERRRLVLPGFGLSLIELDVAQFARKGRKLARDAASDLITLRWRLQFVPRAG